MPGSRRYADPASFLLSAEAWTPQRLEFCQLVGKPAAAAEALALTDDEMHTALTDVDSLLAKGGRPGEVRLTDAGELVIPPLTAEDVPGEADALRQEMAGMLPRANCWTIAEHAGDANPYGRQHLLGRAVWDADGVRDDLRRYVVEQLADPSAVLVVDETGGAPRSAGIPCGRRDPPLGTGTTMQLRLPIA